MIPSLLSFATDGATEDDLKALLYEMDMLASIEDHPDIVSLVRVCSVGSEYFLAMQLGDPSLCELEL